MSSMTVWKFDRPDGASQARRVLQELQDEGLIVVDDAAVVEWPPGAKKPATHQLHDLVGPAALGGAFWGLLFGIVFFMPLLGAAAGAGGGALMGALSDVGVDDDLIKRLRSSVTPGTSALFLLSSKAVQDRVHQRFIGTHAELIFTDLSADDEKRLREAFQI